jgi:hypothetical protein
VAVSVSFPNAFDDLDKFARLRSEAAALEATRRAAVIAKGRIRDAMKSAALGRLGNAIGHSSDAEKRGTVYRQGDGFSASGVVFVRSKSERTLGAIESYTQGAEIRPVRGRWLWIPTDDIARVAGAKEKRARVTPGNWSKLGLDNRIGPLVFAKAKNGNPILIVKNVGVSATGASRSAKNLRKSGQPRKGQVAREFIVAFIAIPRTARAARIDVAAILRSVAQELPALFTEALGRIS